MIIPIRGHPNRTTTTPPRKHELPFSLCFWKKNLNVLSRPMTSASPDINNICKRKGKSINQSINLYFTIVPDSYIHIIYKNIAITLAPCRLLSAENEMDPGAVPQELQGLTEIEEIQSLSDHVCLPQTWRPERLIKDMSSICHRHPGFSEYLCAFWLSGSKDQVSKMISTFSVWKILFIV